MERDRRCTIQGFENGYTFSTVVQSAGQVTRLSISGQVNQKNSTRGVDPAYASVEAVNAWLWCRECCGGDWAGQGLQPGYRLIDRGRKGPSFAAGGGGILRGLTERWTGVTPHARRSARRRPQAGESWGTDGEDGEADGLRVAQRNWNYTTNVLAERKACVY